MAIKKWDVIVNGATHEVCFKTGSFKNSIIVDGNEIPIKSLSVTKEKSVVKFEIPVAGDIVYLYSLYTMKKLVHNGIDVETGEPYVPMKLTPMTWVFTILYAICFFVVAGGAVGGALDFLGIALTAKIANDTSKSKGIKILMCTGLFALIIAAELIIVAALTSL